MSGPNYDCREDGDQVPSYTLRLPLTSDMLFDIVHYLVEGMYSFEHLSQSASPVFGASECSEWHLLYLPVCHHLLLWGCNMMQFHPFFWGGHVWTSFHDHVQCSVENHHPRQHEFLQAGKLYYYEPHCIHPLPLWKRAATNCKVSWS
jgi:hypothetical protein